MNAVAEVLRLAPSPQRSYEACPAWCLGHSDDRMGIRTHAGRTEVVSGTSPDTGRRTNLTLWSERRDDGAGSRTDVWILTVGNIQIELPRGRAHDLMQSVERAFWRLDERGLMYPPRRTAGHF